MLGGFLYRERDGGVEVLRILSVRKATRAERQQYDQGTLNRAAL